MPLKALFLVLYAPIICFSFRYRNNELQGPGYIAVDKDGFIYIIGRRSKNIHLLKPDGRQVKVFKVEDGSDASSIAYRHSDGLFVIGSMNSDKIRTYKLH